MRANCGQYEASPAHRQPAVRFSVQQMRPPRHSQAWQQHMRSFRAPQFSSGISGQFRPDVVEFYGISEDVSCSYFDPVQSLYIVGTRQGSVKVYGKSGCQRTFLLDPRQPVEHVFLNKTVYLLALDAANCITVWDITTNEKWAHYHFPSQRISHYWDPALDWLYVGQKNGQTCVYDIDRGIISHFLIENIQLQLIPAARLGGVLSVQVHPRDVSQVLVCYSDMFAVYSVSTNQIMFHAKGKEKLQFAKWSPGGTHIMTGSELSLAFWDGYQGRFLSTRHSGHTTEPVWCSKESPDDSYIVYGKQHSLVKVTFGPTPVYSVTSWDAFGKFFANPPELAVALDGPVVEITPMSQTPYFGGGHNPSYFVVRAQDQTLKTVKANLKDALSNAVLPAPLCYSATKISCSGLSTIPRLTWTGIMVSAPKPLVSGGSPTVTSRLAQVSLVLNGYVDGTIRILSEAAADSRVIETSIAEAAPGPVTHLSLSEDGAELAAASFSGAVVLLGFQRNTHGIQGLGLNNAEIENVSHTALNDLKEGYLPLWKIKARGQETVSALFQSDLGFVAIGYSTGRIIVVDKRGPATILDENLGSLPTKFAFGIQQVLTDAYSSIVMSVGTQDGRVILYKVLPRPGGGFQVAKATEFALGSPVTSLAHIDLGAGRQAAASREIMGQLAQGIQVNGGLLACSSDDSRLFSVTGTKPKLAHKRLDKSLGNGFACLRAGDALGLITVNSKGKLTAYGIPSLSSLFSYDLPQFPIGPVSISLNGNVLVPLTDRCASLVRVWGIGGREDVPEMFVSSRKLPLRPEISATEWVSGRQYVKIADLDELISGNRRPKPRKERKVFMDAQPETTHPKAPSQNRGWFEQAHPHSYASAMPTQSKTWGQAFGEYYDSAADAVNGAMDGAIDQVKTTQKNATKDIAKGIMKSKFGF